MIITVLLGDGEGVIHTVDVYLTEQVMQIDMYTVVDLAMRNLSKRTGLSPETLHLILDQDGQQQAIGVH